MTLIPLNRKNFVSNNVEVRPSIDYVSASDLFNNFDKIDDYSQSITAQGISGSIKAIGTFSPSIKESNKYYAESHTKNTNINNFRESTSVENYLINAGNLEGLHKDNYSFGIDRIQQRYMPHDINLQKKLTTKNCLYKNYQYNQGNDIIENPTWSFSNYNCINFFTIGNNHKNFDDDKIHQNCIVYPNINRQYDWSGQDYTVSFWINPRYKQPIGQQKNNSCIINIPDLINIYQIKGTQKDSNDLEETFRLGITFEPNTLVDIELTDLDLTNNTNQANNNNYITKDCLKFNNWHNVSVKLGFPNSREVRVEIFVDANSICDFTHNYDSNRLVYTQSFICLGNKIKLQDGTLESLFNTLFSTYNILGIGGGGFNKFISAGENRDLPSSQPDYIFTDNLSNLRTDSEALEAEIHDIRIYNIQLSKEKIEKICKHGVSSIENEESLIFYVPVYFVPDDVIKITRVNGAPQDENSFVQTTFNFVTNPYYFNNCGGHKLTSELFLLEHIKKTRPNITIGGNFIKESYGNSIELFMLTSWHTESHQDFSHFVDSKLGKPYYDLYLKETLSTDQSAGEKAQKHSDIYNNNLIMPCDNGLQAQYFDIIKENFDTGIVTSSYMFKEFNGLYNYSKVNIESFFAPGNEISEDFRPLPSGVSNSFFSSDTENTLFIDPNASVIESIDIADIADSRTISIPYNDKLHNISNANYHESNLTDIGELDKKRRDFTSFGYGLADYFNQHHKKSNPVVRDYGSATLDTDGNSLKEINIQKQFPLFKITQDPVEFHSIIYSISNQLYNRKIRKNTFSIRDYDLCGSGNAIQINLKESGRGMLYRGDALTKHAEWNYIGHIFYSEGICTILHPSLYNFGKTNYRVKFESENAIFVNEVNIPLRAGHHNRSYNKSYDKDLKISESAFEQDQKFVYISEVNLHDESLNIVARAKLAQPIVKRETDNLLLRLKMDY